MIRGKDLISKIWKEQFLFTEILLAEPNTLWYIH